MANTSRASGGEYGRVGDRRLVVWNLIKIPRTQPDLIGDCGAGCPSADVQIARPLVENRQHFPCRIVRGKHGRGGGAGKVRGGDCRALNGEGVGGDCATNRRERADGHRIANRDGGDADGDCPADGCGD